MRPAEDTHGVELDQPDTTHNLAEVPDINTPAGTSFNKTLRREGISPGLTPAYPSHRTATLTGVASSDP